MLEDRKWENTAPEVPVEFHARFEQTLEEIEKKPSGKRIKLRVFAVVAAACALCTATVAAKEAFKWSDALLKIFQPSQAQQQELVEEGFVQGVGQSVTQSGVTVTLQEALQDSHSVYILFEVETPESIVMDDTAEFESGLNLTVDGKYIFDALREDGIMTSGSGGGGFVDMNRYGEQEEDASHKRYYEISYNFLGDEYDFSGKTLEVSLENLMLGGEKALPGKVVAEGAWNFRWQVGDIGSEKRIEINRTYDFGGYEICIESLDISPLGYVIYADYDDAMKVEEDERNTFTYTGDDPGMEIDARIGIRAVEYQDGTKVELMYGDGGGADPDKENGVYKVQERFGQVVDVENLKAVYLMQGDVRVPLSEEEKGE
ncbi:MAG: DUF4179 domain-containing protein [Eubacteriales bacterium]|nr:DUF4179 domain-containing protein [Eubacteriales bacterium]